GGTLVAMCYSDDARPPLPPVGGAASDQGEIHLTSADGNRFMAYFAHAADPSGAGMVVMPDVRGVHAFYKELAQRFAEAGIDAVAFYGDPARVRVVSRLQAPLLLLVAGADFRPLEAFQGFDAELAEAGVPHRMVVYEGAPHSFFDRSFKDHAEAAADSWRQMLDFVKENAAHSTS